MFEISNKREFYDYKNVQSAASINPFCFKISQTDCDSICLRSKQKQSPSSFKELIKNCRSISFAGKSQSSEKKVSSKVLNELRKSIKYIPQSKEEKAAFVEKFLCTNLKTGIYISDEDINGNDKYTIEMLANYENEDLAIVLEHVLKMCEMEDVVHPLYFNLDANIDVYKNIKNRDLYSIMEQRRNVEPDFDCDFSIIRLGILSDINYKKAINSMQKIGMYDTKIDFENIIEFVLNTDEETVNYMAENDLFNPNNMQSFSCRKDKFNTNIIFRYFKKRPKILVEKMHKRGLLQEIPGRTKNLDFTSAIDLVKELSDEEWQQVEKRGLLSLKTNTNKYLSSIEICDLAKLTDDVYSNIEKRDLLNKTGDKVQNLKVLAEVDDDSWQKILDRKINISKIDFREEENLTKLLSITDEQWKTAEKRGLTFVDDNDYKLLELNDEHWNNLINRKLNAVDEHERYIYDFESQIRLAKLTDEEFNTVIKRRLIHKEWRFGSERGVFSEEDLMLTKLSDSDYSLYKKRELDKLYISSLEIKQNLLKMSNAQYERFYNDIAPVALRSNRYNATFSNRNDIIEEYYKLAYLDEDKYETAKQFLNLEYLENTKQFNYEDINTIVNLKPENIERLKNIVLYYPFYQNEKYSKSSLIRLAELDNDTFYKIIQTETYFSIHQIDNYLQNDVMLKIVNSETFNKNKNIVLEINSSKLMQSEKDELINILFGINCNYSQMNLKEKMKKIDMLQNVQRNKILSNKTKKYLKIDEEIEKIQHSIKSVISTTEVTKYKSEKMMTEFFANNNPCLDKLLSTANFAKYGKNGLPLLYSRSKFLNDLNSILKNLPNEKQENIIKKLGINLIKDGEKLGYDGIIDLKKLSKKGIEGDILKLATKFIKENSVQTGDKELDYALNSLIQGMPEFINIIGKQQHETHSFSLDIHILSVLKEAMANPDYKNLSNEEKFCLKFAAVLHDIAKAEGIKDEGHASLCALYARDILNKSNVKMPDKMKNRIYELIKNHHWLADYDKGIKKAEELAVLFRRNGDLKIAQILSEADLKGVTADGSFYRNHAHVLNSSKQLPVINAINKININAQMFFTSKIIDNSKIPTIKYNGRWYQIINLKELNPNTDLYQYGFEKGTTVDNLRLFIHTVNQCKLNKLEDAFNLSDPSYQGLLCASYVSVNHHPTYTNNQFGVSLVSENVNIANAALHNQTSGTGKGLNSFIDIITKDVHRDLIPNYIKKALDITDNEYIELYGKIQNYECASELDDVDFIKIGDKQFTGRQIKQVISEADDLMMQNSRNNEANLYTPKTNAVAARVNSFSELPQKLLDFAYKHHLPIIILGD